MREDVSHWRAARSLVWAVCVALSAGSIGAQGPVGLLSLPTGDRLPGRLQAADADGVIRWHGDGFSSTFDFPTTMVGTLQFPAVQPPPKLAGEYAIESADGDLLTGRILAWDEQTVELQAEHFGLIHLRTAAIRRMYRLNENPTIVYPALTGLIGWNSNGKTWREDGTEIETDQNEALLSSDVKLPAQSMLDFVLSWTGQPAFNLALGVDPSKTADLQQEGWRFEIWGNELTIVREQQLEADVDRVLTLNPGIKRVHLRAYLDQTAGSLHVFLPDGTPAGKVSVKPDRAGDPARGLRLINRHGHVRLERLRITRWNGVLPTATDTEQSQCQLADGTELPGKVIGLSEDGRSFTVQSGDEKKLVPVDQLLTAELVSKSVGERQPTAVILQDGTRLSGALDARGAESISVQNPSVNEPLTIPHATLRSIMVSQRPESKTDTLDKAARVGRLEIGELQLQGVFAPQTESATTHCLAFQPAGSLTSSPLRPDVAGRMVYRATKKPLAKSESEVSQPKAGRNFAELFLAKSRDAKTGRVSQAHNLYLRSGDVVPCAIAAIDEEGVTITSTVANATLVPHSQIKAVELSPGSTLPDIVAAKKARLLTLPRLQKLSPPTHLLCSKTGDFLRGRLVSMSVDKLVMEIHLEEHVIPRERVSQIVWFHPDELPAVATDAESPSGADTDRAAVDDPLPAPPAKLGTGLVQAIESNGNRVTFDPAQLEGSVLSGHSDILGDCRVDLNAVDELVLGSQIVAAVSDLPYQDWKLTPAVEPLFTQETGGDATAEGEVSPLVGQPAPPLKLELLAGGRFDLADCRGQIVLLDFWASWCGPCMQTMPLLEAALQDFDPRQVRLVSVNLEEPAEHIRTVLERHELHMEVALDVDGVAAHRYQANAIPQLVIVDGQGKIVRLYIGGGPQVVEQIKAALTELLAPSPAQPMTGEPPAT